MTGTIPALDALIAKYGDARVLAVIEALQAERKAAADAAQKARRS